MDNTYKTPVGASAHKQVSTITNTGNSTVRTVHLQVAGQRVSIRTDQDPDYLHYLAAEVNTLLESLRQASPGTGMPVLMALAAVQLADRAVAAEKTVVQENIKLERHIERLNSILNALDNASD